MRVEGRPSEKHHHQSAAKIFDIRPCECVFQQLVIALYRSSEQRVHHLQETRLRWVTGKFLDDLDI